MFGMGTGVSLAPWTPTLALVARCLLTGKASNTATLLANWGVGNARPLTRSTVSTARSSPRYLLPIHPNTSPKAGVDGQFLKLFQNSRVKVSRKELLLKVLVVKAMTFLAN